MGNTAAYGPTRCMSAASGGAEPDGEERVPDGPVGRHPVSEGRDDVGDDRRDADQGGGQVAADSLEPLLDVLAEIALEALSGAEE